MQQDIYKHAVNGQVSEGLNGQVSRLWAVGLKGVLK